jgi:tRNA(fMet)-specific endonuclease VapC
VSRLLDTNICIAFLNGSDPAVRDRLLAEQADDLALCSIVKAELLYGARNSIHVESNLRKLERFFEPFRSFEFGDAAADWYGQIRAHLRRSGQLIGANDLMIAAIALAEDATLVTRNHDEFRRVVGLRLETW